MSGCCAEFVITTLSFFDAKGKNPEAVFQAFVLGMLLNLGQDYAVSSNRELGYGRYDVLVLPRAERDGAQKLDKGARRWLAGDEKHQGPVPGRPGGEHCHSKNRYTAGVMRGNFEALGYSKCPESRGPFPDG